MTSTSNIQISIDFGSVTWTSFGLDDECPQDNTSCTESVASTGSGVKTGSCLSLNAGTYYLQVDTWSSPDCISSFDLSITTC